jgi:hypothetical protein
MVVRNMHSTTCNNKRLACAGLLSGLLLCLAPAAALAQLSNIPEPGSAAPQFQPIVSQNPAPVLAFDLAGSDTRKLQLQLSEPLSLDAFSESRWLNAGTGSLLAGGALQWTMSDKLKLNAALGQQQSRVQFRPLGSIHCENGVLQAGSYRASGCYFTNDGATVERSSFKLGAEYGLGEQSLARFSLFRQDAELDARHLLPGSTGLTQSVMPPMGGPTAPAFLFPGAAGVSSLNYLESEVSGIDLEFKLGVSTDRAGDMQLGLQFTRVLDGEFGSNYVLGEDLLQWTLAEPVDSASLSFDWQRNSFSGGIQGFYREPMEFLNRNATEALTTFDVYFTWRTPWNASLSVGASNLLNSGMDDAAVRENTIKDPFEAVYGRIPYVRYQQDL